VFVRTGYHILTALFILPVFGYFTALFHKRKQGVQDKISGTFIITRNPARKALISWIFIALLSLGSIGSVVRTGVPSHFFDSVSLIAQLFFNPPKSEVFLPPIWEEEFEDTVYNSMKKGENILVVVGETIKALSSRTGELLWQYQCAGSPRISSEAEKEEEFLFFVDSTAPDQYRLNSLSLDDGSLLWSKALQLNQISGLLRQGNFIFVYSDASLSAFTLSGRYLWNTILPTGDISAVLSSSGQRGILVDTQNYQSETAAQYYLAVEDGKILWQRKLTLYHKSVPVADNYLYEQNTSDGTASLIQMDTHQVSWMKPGDTDYLFDYVVVEHEKGDDIPEGLLYLQNKAIRIKDGETAFDYPNETRFAARTSKFLLLETTTSSETQDTLPDRELLLLDWKTGKTILAPISLGSRTVTSIEEQGTELFLSMVGLEMEENYFSGSSSLLIIDSETGRSKLVELGTNLSRATFFPSRDHIVIVQEDMVGGYALLPVSGQH